MSHPLYPAGAIAVITVSILNSTVLKNEVDPLYISMVYISYGYAQ